MDEYIFFVEKSFSRALKEVAGTMAGFDLVEAFEGDLGEEQQDKTKVSGVMTLKGIRNAMMVVTVSKDSAFVLVSYMTGIEPHELKEEDLFDGIAELANMVSGRAKALLADSGYQYDLTFPFVITGENHYIVHKGKVNKTKKRFAAGVIDIEMEVFIL
ncbi:MAG: chemotaxis protein CheX [Bacillota bacterium]